MVDVNVNFEFSEDEPIQSTFNVEPDVSFVADLSLETYKIPTHGELSGRDLPNQHPMTAITGLSDTLNLLDEKIGDETIRAIYKENQLENSLSQKANISDLSTVATSGQYSDLIGVPTKLSDFSNDEGFIDNTVNNLSNYYLKSETYTKTEVQSLIAEIPTFSVQVLQQLPQTGEELVLYFVPKDGTSPDIYDEYIWLEDDSSFELIGNTQVDLTGYATETWVQNQDYATETYVDNGLSTKQNTLTAGNNIEINNNVISATDTTYTAGTGISIENGVISNTQTSAEWGNITGDIEDQTDLIELLDTKQDKLTSENAGNQIEIVEGGSGEDVTVSGNGSVFMEKAKADSLNSVTISGGLKRSLLPDGYTQYDYITVNGDCYFITDYYPSNITEVKTKTFVHKQPNSPLVCRWTSSPTNDTFGFYMGNVSGRLTVFYGRYGDTKYLNIESVKLNMEHDIYMGVKSITFDGTSYSITRDTFTSTQPIYIGAFNQAGTTLSGMMYGRIYPVQFIENGRTVKHYIPCKNDSGVIGLYEAISGTFISPASGTAKKGRPYINVDTIPDDYTRIEFLQSTGTQYIDSGVIANFANNKIEQSATVQYTTSNANRELMGTNGYGFWGKNASNKIEAALGNVTVTDSALDKNVINWTTNPDGNALILNVNDNQYTSTASSFVNADYAYYVFALGIRVGSGADASFLCHAKVYDYMIAVDNEVVCYLIPVKRNSDDVLGMYDVVSGTFKTNAGTGTFTAGSNIALPSPTNPLPIVSNNGELEAIHTSGLPLGYTRVEYIQSSGTQYINTGYVISDLTNKYSVHLRMAVDGGTGEGTPSNNWGYMGINGGLMLTYTHDYGLGLGSAGVPVTENRIFDITMTRNSDASRVLVIDNTTFTTTNQSTVYADRPFGIFRLSPFSTEFNRIYGKVYEFQGYVNDVLVCNLIPCRRNSDSVLGMYDTVSGTFLTNAGTDTFLAGNNVTDDVIVYTDGVTETITDSANNSATAEMLLSIGNYADTQEILTGDVTRKVGVIVLNGTEEWRYNTSGAFYCDDFTDILLPNECICTHFVGVSSTFNIASMPNNSIKTGSITITRLYVKTADYADVAAFKTWLAQQYNAGTPVIIVYPLATETTETVTGQTLTTVDGDNTLSIQASIENLPITANYTQKGGTVINVDLTTIDGFDATKTQILKHINGTLTWVDE